MSGGACEFPLRFSEASGPLKNHGDFLVVTVSEHLQAIESKWYLKVTFWSQAWQRNIKMISKSQTCQPLVKENLETHEKKSGDSTKNSEILFFPRLNPFSIAETRQQTHSQDLLLHGGQTRRKTISYWSIEHKQKSQLGTKKVVIKSVFRY